MKKFTLLNFISFFIFSLQISSSCNKPPYRPDYKNAKGYVIAKEVCTANEADDYWLIDLTYLNGTPQYGDSLILNGRTYTNVIKTKGLDPRLKQNGMTVSLDFKTITSDKIQTTGCTVTNPVTYDLKELFIINQFEIR
jgi:hypothetical protein